MRNEGRMRGDKGEGFREQGGQNCLRRHHYLLQGLVIARAEVMAQLPATWAGKGVVVRWRGGVDG